MARSLCAVLLLFLFCVVWVAAKNTKCPGDYRYRVETCVMEAQVAPQAGGGLPLITDRNKLDELCQRGILIKTIDCLQELHDRCSGNSTIKHELDMLFNLDDWKQGKGLLCEDLNLFRNHFDCLSKFGPRIFTCIMIRTQMFKKDVTDAGIVPSRTLHNITCNFAENIVNCLEQPLARACPIQVVDTMVSALHRFLPPACAPVPAVYSSDAKNSQDMASETLILEGGDDSN